MTINAINIDSINLVYGSVLRIEGKCNEKSIIDKLEIFPHLDFMSGQWFDKYGCVYDGDIVKLINGHICHYIVPGDLVYISLILKDTWVTYPKTEFIFRIIGNKYCNEDVILAEKPFFI